MSTAKIMIDGMSCMHCVSRVKQFLDDLDGVSDSDVQVGSATVNYDGSKLGEADLEAAITKAGYKVKK